MDGGKEKMGISSFPLSSVFFFPVFPSAPHEIWNKFQNTAFSNEIMEKIFSEMEIINNEGNWILIKNING